MVQPELSIERSKQVIVEGEDDVRVLNALSRYLSVSDVQVVSCGGYDNLSNFLRILRVLPDFARLQSLAVVVDADQDAEGRRRGVSDRLASAGLPRPVRPLEPISEAGLTVTYLVVPHDAEGTMMEDVCLNSVSDDPAMGCVDQYFDCVSRADTPGPRQMWMSKARSHAFLASRDRPDLRLGEAAERGVWRFDSEEFRPLIDLLRML